MVQTTATTTAITTKLYKIQSKAISLSNFLMWYTSFFTAKQLLRSPYGFFVAFLLFMKMLQTNKMIRIFWVLCLYFQFNVCCITKAHIFTNFLERYLQPCCLCSVSIVYSIFLQLHIVLYVLCYFYVFPLNMDQIYERRQSLK